MNYNLVKKISTCILSFVLTFTVPTILHADDILKGPIPKKSKFQLDTRFTYTRNEKGITTLTNNIIGKYWEGDRLGKWVFINVPYKSVINDQESSNGFGDITVGVGPGGRINNLHILSYFALTFPTGDSNERPALGNGRYDKKIGVVHTFLTNDKGFEIDTTVEYNLTGVNNKDINPPNEFYFGFIFGGKINERIRFATGLTDLVKANGDFLLNSRSVLRYTFSPKIHLEALIDHGIQNHNVLKYDGLSLFLRYNL